MPQIALVVLGLFVLVWIISAVVKASQDTGPRSRPGQGNRARPVTDIPRTERTSDNDIDRFMAEIDRLRRRGEGGPATARPPELPRQSRPVLDRPPLAPPPRPEPRPRPSERKDRDRERRVRLSQRPAAPPPPPAPESLPVLRPVAPEPPPKPAPLRPAKPAATSATSAVQAGPVSPLLETLQAVLKTRQGPGAAIILAEIFGEAPGKRALMRSAPKQAG